VGELAKERILEFKLKEIEEIYHAALEKEAGTQLSAYLDTVCKGDTRLRSQIEALLKANEESADFLENPGFGVGVNLDESPLSEGPGTTIGRYKLLEKIGEGGMAVVYMAEQTAPIRRKVALKIIKLGMDTKSVIARFEAERQALAMMDHPSIAKVLDAGATETGRPYFVMELVTGISITEYCDKNNLSTKERLALFIQVCNAVQHAHQKGIIHRDIKPTNVMVTRHEGQPIPKVIDFGIAKAINQKLTEKTLFTRYAHIIGTPAYMSPEQAELSDLDIDTRTDIYSLGVMLYELLTGTTPFSEEELRKAGYIEMQHIIREQEPPKPSTKLSTLAETLTDIAKYRGCTPDLLTKAIRGDLDWIVMKTLEKTRERRYDNASALALDIQRHLEDQPILARAPGTFYRLHKFFRRHQIQIIASSVVTLLAATLLAVLLAGKLKQRRLESQVFLMHKITLSRAINSLFYGDPVAALADVESVLDSEYVGTEARRRHDEILASIRKRVRSCTQKIEANPEDAQSYLIRAQQYYCLHEKENMIADMETYVNILTPLDETNPHDL
jgi:serine/threonine protein kinase